MKKRSKKYRVEHHKSKRVDRERFGYILGDNLNSEQRGRLRNIVEL